MDFSHMVDDVLRPVEEVSRVSGEPLERFALFTHGILVAHILKILVRGETCWEVA